MSTSTAHVDHLVDDYLHELLSPDEAGRVETHCSGCDRCARALDQARRRLAILRAVPSTEPSAGLVQNTLERIDDHSARKPRLGKRFWIGVVGTLAASALLLLGANLYYANVLTAGSIDLVVLGQRDLLAATTASLRVRLADRSSNTLLAGVPVVVTLKGIGKAQELASFTTDEQGNGSPRFELPDWPEGKYELEVRAKGESITRPITLKRAWKLMLSTDKPLYQPGQTILMRSLGLRRPDLKPVAGKQAVFTLTDPRGNVLFKHSQATSTHGIASAECLLAHEIQEGAFTVTVDVEGTQSKQTVEIKRYVLPKFKVGVTVNRPYYTPREKATVTFQADYFFGKPVAEGQLAYEITSLTGQRIAQKESVRLDAKGTHRLELTLPANLPGRPNDSGDARVMISATVTDSAGQKYPGSGEMLVTSRPVRVEAIPESGTLVPNLTNTVYLLVRRADGAPVPGARVQITGTDVSTEVKTDERGAASFEVRPTVGEVAWTMTVRDNAGEVLARRNDRLAVGGVPGDFLVRLDRAVCRAGQSLTITALGGGTEPVFLDLVKDGQTMLSQMLPIADGKGELTFDVPPDLFGTVQLVAYRFTGAHGLPVRKARVMYVTPPDGLRIETTLDQGEYRPGREATINVRLFDENGKPTPGAVSLSAVDEAVFAVLTQRPGMERSFYNLEQELLKPVYAIYPWQPGDEPNATQRDRALFATTARGLDTPVTGNTRMVQIPEVGPHTLGVRSLPIREQQTEALRKVRLGQVRNGWVGVVCAGVLFAYLAAWMFFPTIEVIKFHCYAGIGMVCLTILTLAFSPQAKHAAMRSAGMAMEKSARSEMVPTAEDRVRVDKFSAFRLGAEANLAEPRVRRHFPETLLWKPELITDDTGRLPPVKVTLADSITTWRLAASAVAADGRLGAGQWPIKVFQPFFVDLNLPVALTRGDEVGVPVVVYNYLDRPQSVTLTLTESPWFTLDGTAVRKLDLAAGEVRSLRYTLKAAQVGTHPLKVTAIAGEVSDAIERQVEVIPDGKKMEFAYSGGLDKPAQHTLDVPAGVIDGSVKAFVKLYPSSFSTLLEGLENIFQMPSGCFEQTSSTTYPNILALDYLRRNKLAVPQVEAKAKQYIHLGYQRLVGFEVPGGGFDWYGRPPANVTLTAYGLMEFVDMAKVHDVDPKLIQRTAAWLMGQRQADGSWSPDGRGAHIAGVRDQQSARLATTAYVAWAVFSSEQIGLVDALVTLNWILAHKPEDIHDPHTLALVCNLLAKIDPNNRELSAYVERLAALAKRSEDGKMVSWQQDAGGRTTFYGAGLSGQVETTALAVLALVEAKVHPELARAGLAWLVAQKDARGTWHSTQATVLALKALLAGTSQPLGGEQERRIEVRLGKHLQDVVIPADQAEVMKLLDVSRHLGSGSNQIQLVEKTSTGASYQVVFRYHVPEAKAAAKEEPLAIALEYDRTELSVGGVVKVKATVENRQAVTAPMVMLDLPIPPGFAAQTEDFTALEQKNTIARFQVLPRSVLVYLRGLEPGAKLEFTYTLSATMPVQVAAQAARLYEYYDPQKQGASKPTRFVVKPGE